jgi:hypothetical protein
LKKAESRKINQESEAKQGSMKPQHGRQKGKDPTMNSSILQFGKETLKRKRSSHQFPLVASSAPKFKKMGCFEVSQGVRSFTNEFL